MTNQQPNNNNLETEMQDLSTKINNLEKSIDNLNDTFNQIKAIWNFLTNFNQGGWILITVFIFLGGSIITLWMKVSVLEERLSSLGNTEEIKKLKSEINTIQNLQQQIADIEKKVSINPTTPLKETDTQLEITKPKNNQVFTTQQGAEGIDFEVNISNRNIEEQLWIVVNPATTDYWYPQKTLPKQNQTFKTKVYFGDDQSADYISIVLVDPNADQAFKNYLRDVEQTRKYPPKPLPDGAFLVKGVRISRE